MCTDIHDLDVNVIASFPSVRVIQLAKLEKTDAQEQQWRVNNRGCT